MSIKMRDSTTLGNGVDGGTIIEDLRNRLDTVIGQNMSIKDATERVQLQLASASDVVLEPGEGSM